MDRINEIGDTPKGQYALGQVYARANKRRSGIADAWTKQMPKKEYYTAAEYYPKGTKKYDDIMYDAKSEAECPPNRKVNMKSVVYNDKGYETTNFGLGIMDYEKSHKTNENKQYTNMNKKLIRLTESDLHKIVKESVQNILKENEGNDLVRLLPQVTGAIRNAEMMLDEVDLPENFGNQLGDGGINTIKQIRDYLGKASDLCVILYQEHAFGRKNYLPGDGGGGEQRDYSGLSGWGG